jgi:hypothetical protein
MRTRGLDTRTGYDRRFNYNQAQHGAVTADAPFLFLDGKLIVFFATAITTAQILAMTRTTPCRQRALRRCFGSWPCNNAPKGYRRAASRGMVDAVTVSGTFFPISIWQAP